MTTLIDISGGRLPIVSTFYRVCERLGAGRFAEVYKAFDTNSSTDVSLKIYLQADEGAHRLAHAECDTLQQLAALNTEYFPRLRKSLKHLIRNRNHPVVVMELGQYFGTDGRAMTVSLKEVLASSDSDGPVAEFWNAEELRRWVLDLGLAVKLLHDSGIVHRDIKPANILLKRRAGGAQATPFLLDFNSSVRDKPDFNSTGTRLYLPPEVVAGQRQSPSAADDLWAVAMTLWEIIHGLGSAVADGAKPQDRCPQVLHSAATPVLRRALSLQAVNRYSTAAELFEALDAALATSAAVAIADNELTSDAWIAARREMEAIRDRIVDELAGDEELPIPKDIQEQVATLFSWLADEDTQSFDLMGDLVRLGPRAIPAILQEAHRLDPKAAVFEEVVTALTDLAKRSQPIVTRALSFYSTSSNLGVRRMCRAVCQSLESFPAILVDSLVTDEGVLLPEERLELAGLCIRYCDDATTAILALTKYMCREYVIDPNRYHELRNGVAVPLGQSSFAKKALLVVQDTSQRIWEELPEFDRLPDEKRDEIEKGLLQLMADAFGGMGDEALSLLKSNRVPRKIEGPTPIRPWRAFARELARHYPPAKSWIEAELEVRPGDPDLKYLKDVLGREGTSTETDDELSGKLERYLSLGERRDFDDLRHKWDGRVFEFLARRLRSGSTIDEQRRVVHLLRGFQNRMRERVVRILIDHWGPLSGADFEGALEALAGRKISQTALREQAVSKLGPHLTGPHAARVRGAINRLLGA